VPDDRRAAVANNLVADITSKGHFTSGIIGISQLFLMLSDTGHHDVAVALASSIKYPSYGWTFNNPWENATTIWESFNANLDGGGSSHNHHMFSSIGSWFWRYLAGINLNGLTTITLYPRLQHDHSLLSSVYAETITSKGRVSVSWESEWQQSLLVMNVSLPPNAQGRVVVECPVKGSRWASLKLNGEWLLRREAAFAEAGSVSGVVLDGVTAWRERGDGAVEVEAMSGAYDFVGVWE
jgi:alpha-L-rhamnosidase